MMQSMSLMPEASAIRRGLAGMLTAPRRVFTVRVAASAGGEAPCPEAPYSETPYPESGADFFSQPPRARDRRRHKPRPRAIFLNIGIPGAASGVKTFIVFSVTRGYVRIF
jgi:hypothetical protein